MKKFVTALLITLMVCSAAFATGGKEDTGKTVIEYWSSWSATENQALILQDAAKEFEAAHPDVKINFTFNGRDNRNLVVSAIQSGTQIDMMDANVDNIQSLWADNVADLTAYMNTVTESTNGKTYIDTVMPSMTALAADLFDGKYGYVPYTPQGYMIFCNKGLLEEVGITSYPQTWEEFLDVCEIIKNAGYIPVTTDAAYATSWVGYYLSRLIGNDAVEALVNGQHSWNDPKVLEGLKAIEDMAKKGYFDPAIESNQYPVAQQSMVINGNVAFYINGTWLPNEVAATTPEDFEWGAFAFPSVPGGVEGTEAGCYSSYGIALNKDSSQEIKDLSFEFAAFVTTGKWDAEFPVRANAIPMDLSNEWPSNLADAKEVLSSYTVRYPSQTALTTNSTNKQVIQDNCLKLMGGSITSEQFIAEVSKF